jgi:hypothetical protein
VNAPDAAKGEPLFSFERNDFSSVGRCPLGHAKLEDVRPCNPTWDPVKVEQVCGKSQACSQVEPVALEDCVFANGRWRPIRGTDVATPDEWIVEEPGTRQDPELIACTEYATSSNGELDEAKLLDCVHQLGAADQRGVCDIVSYDPPRDVCDEMN